MGALRVVPAHGVQGFGCEELELREGQARAGGQGLGRLTPRPGPSRRDQPMKELLEYIARSLVDEPMAVRVDEEHEGDLLVLRLEVAPDDVGKVIGRGGRIARAIRAVMRAAAVKAGVAVNVEIAG
jgi:uncharacterized protein